MRLLLIFWCPGITGLGHLISDSTLLGLGNACLIRPRLEEASRYGRGERTYSYPIAPPEAKGLLLRIAKVDSRPREPSVRLSFGCLLSSVGSPNPTSVQRDDTTATRSVDCRKRPRSGRQQDIRLAAVLTRCSSSGDTGTGQADTRAVDRITTAVTHPLTA